MQNPNVPASGMSLPYRQAWVIKAYYFYFYEGNSILYDKIKVHCRLYSYLCMQLPYLQMLALVNPLLRKFLRDDMLYVNKIQLA